MDTGTLSFYTVDRERWNLLPILDQMGNIGTEAGRTLETYFMQFAIAARINR